MASIARPSQSSALDIGGGERGRCGETDEPVTLFAELGGICVAMIQQKRSRV